MKINMVERKPLAESTTHAELSQILKIAKAIGMKDLNDLQRFISEHPRSKDLQQDMKDYRDRLGAKFHIKESFDTDTDEAFAEQIPNASIIASELASARVYLDNNNISGMIDCLDRIKKLANVSSELNERNVNCDFNPLDYGSVEDVDENFSASNSTHGSIMEDIKSHLAAMPATGAPATAAASNANEISFDADPNFVGSYDDEV